MEPERKQRETVFPAADKARDDFHSVVKSGVKRWRQTSILDLLGKLSATGFRPTLLWNAMPGDEDEGLATLALLVPQSAAREYCRTLRDGGAFVVSGWEAPRRGGQMVVRVPVDGAWLRLDMHVGGLAVGDLIFLPQRMFEYAAAPGDPFTTLAPSAAALAFMFRAIALDGEMTTETVRALSQCMASPRFDRLWVHQTGELAGGIPVANYFLRMLGQSPGPLPRGRKAIFRRLVSSNRPSAGPMRPRTFGLLGLHRTFVTWSEPVCIVGLSPADRLHMAHALREWAHELSIPCLAMIFGNQKSPDSGESTARLTVVRSSPDTGIHRIDSSDFGTEQRQGRHVLLRLARAFALGVDLDTFWSKRRAVAHEQGVLILADMHAAQSILRPGLDWLRRLGILSWPAPGALFHLYFDGNGAQVHLSASENDFRAYVEDHGWNILRVECPSPQAALPAVVAKLMQHRWDLAMNNTV